MLVIPDYNVIVAGRDDKYTLLNSSGEMLFGLVADDIYMTISGGEKHYYISVNDNIIDAEEYLESRGIRNQNNSSSSNTSNSSNTTNSNNVSNSAQNNNSGTNNEQNVEENNQEQGNEEQLNAEQLVEGQEMQ